MKQYAVVPSGGTTEGKTRDQLEPLYAEQARERQRGGQGGILLVPPEGLSKGKTRDQLAARERQKRKPESVVPPEGTTNARTRDKLSARERHGMRTDLVPPEGTMFGKTRDQLANKTTAHLRGQGLQLPKRLEIGGGHAAGSAVLTGLML